MNLIYQFALRLCNAVFNVRAESNLTSLIPCKNEKSVQGGCAHYNFINNPFEYINIPQV